jgi:hypothetical protein
VDSTYIRKHGATIKKTIKKCMWSFLGALNGAISVTEIGQRTEELPIIVLRKWKAAL